MKLKAVKEFIEPVTCVNGPVGKDKYLVNLLIGGQFIGVKTFETMSEIDKALEEMQNDQDLLLGCQEEGLEPILTFEISEVKSKEERLAEFAKTNHTTV